MWVCNVPSGFVIIQDINHALNLWLGKALTESGAIKAEEFCHKALALGSYWELETKCLKLSKSTAGHLK